MEEKVQQNKVESKYEKHLRIINEQVEQAKDPANYETYDFMQSDADDHLKVFTARKKGTKHVLENIPCEDYCLSTTVNGCTVLADADGVSSCVHSDIGSKLACEAVVKAVELASNSCPDEDTLVKRLMSFSFRDRLVSYWIQSVMEEVKKLDLSTSEQLKEFTKYGSTIMFAVLTEHWIVTGNLGDGQILVFNDEYGLKLRVHAPKDSSKVRCLVNERCVREDFQVAKYPRDQFNGVLLSTDGMYESFDKGTIFYSYAKQMKERFLSHEPLEPYQAFCYLEKGEPYKDFSAMRTQDDCSIVLALDDTELDLDYTEIEQSILSHTKANFIRRQSTNCMSFYAKGDEGLVDIVVTPLKIENDIPDLKSAKIEYALKTWHDDKYSYVMYPSKYNTLEFMQSSGMLRLDKYRVAESEQMIARVLTQFIELNKELNEYHLKLNSSALFNISFDGNQLYVKRAALSNSYEQVDDAYKEIMNRCFGHVLGILECEDSRKPLFDIGYVDRGRKYTMSGKYSNQELGQVIRSNRTVQFKNTSTYTWQLEDGKTISADEAIDLTDDLVFYVIDESGNRIQEYRYMKKEI